MRTSLGPSPVTRRQFLSKVARYGGSAVLGSMFALDLLAREDRFHLQLKDRAPTGRNNRVIILGGGMAGLCAAAGPFYFAGDWTSNPTGWQAGAFVAAHRAIAAIHARANA